jgi:hypothetical protein
MLKSLLKLALFLIVGVLIYNYFFGTAEEKQQSEEIFISVKDLTKSAVGLLKSEKEKFDEGKYDEAVGKIGGLIDKLKGKAQQLKDNKALLDDIAELEDKQRQLSRRVQGEQVPESYDNPPPPGQEQPEMDSAKRREIEEGWEDLVRKTERVVEEMDRREQ